MKSRRWIQIVVLLITLGVSRLKPAAPSVERATVWIDTVKRGPMTRMVRGSGILTPENIRWIPATTSGRVERLVLRPGAQVAPEFRVWRSSPAGTVSQPPSARSLTNNGSSRRQTGKAPASTSATNESKTACVKGY